MKKQESLTKKIGRLCLTVAAVLAFMAGGILMLAWRAASLEISPAPYQLEAVQRIRTHDFYVELPADWKMTGFSGLVKWPDRYLVFLEVWLPGQEDAARQFDYISGLAGQGDSLEKFTNISDELGRPAVTAPIEYQPDGPLWQPVTTMLINYPHGRLQLFQMADRAPGDRRRSDELFRESVREFLTAYNLSGEAPGPDALNLRTPFGSIVSDRDWPFVYTINSASFRFEGGTFYLAELTEDRLLAGRPGFGNKLGRFFGELDRTGIISGSSFQSRPLGGGRAGDETIRKNPYFDEGRFTLEIDWQARPLGNAPLKLTPSFTMIIPEPGTENQSEFLGLWRAILSRVRFENKP
ncbi:MAG: hypothetical protein LBP33_06460 [Candidatus Adiutrix sp.]|jgi:hypothetical protein|nr:hypothetical protein [Candidatus Adiutrix sp.]